MKQAQNNKSTLHVWPYESRYRWCGPAFLSYILYKVCNQSLMNLSVTTACLFSLFAAS